MEVCSGYEWREDQISRTTLGITIIYAIVGRFKWANRPAYQYQQGLGGGLRLGECNK